ncbi:hypothetical protein PBV87_17260 [Niameybacter massiliensis]|uniref:Uncharacterized protein n=1 Tax=Holtiella tumoricola TaxID=3018743 RepID=A0AA42DQ46_9FIRM|nr:hypothetical protein [Holtiella tumoricola]MDA3733229.1 hypothetical protein [Holtiella tumoricola]
MKRAIRVAVASWLILGSACTTFAIDHNYLTQEEYESLESSIVYSDKGIVVENEPGLGYLVYRDAAGTEKVAKYYSGEIKVEKQPYYDEEDRIGYIDQLFPTFNFDNRDTTIGNIKPGDNIYIQFDDEGYIQYISAYNDYIVRYGKVHTFNMGAGSMRSLVLEDSTGRLYHYSIGQDTPISKASVPYSLGKLKEGEWVRLLVNQRILGAGQIEETVEEIVVDPDSKVISGIYRGELVSVNPYQNTIGIKNNQVLQKNGWGRYESINQLRVDPKTVGTYYLGNAVSFDYIKNRIKSLDGYVYAAVESFRGKDEAVKLNFQTKKQTTLEPTTVTYASPGVVKLLTGEQIYLADDAIIVRENRLVGPASIMVGDRIQATITGENKLAAANILQGVAEGSLEVYRGRIKRIDNYQTFEVETFSLLEDGIWYYHPTPQTFSIQANTKFLTEKGIQMNGIDEFLTYGDNSKESEVYTIIAKGGEAVAISSMPYSKEAIRGEAYLSESGDIRLKDTYYYDRTKKRWALLSRKNATVNVEVSPNTVIVKEGQLVSAKAIKPGDSLMVMMEKSIQDQNKQDNNTGNENSVTSYTAKSYIVIVE